VSVAPPHFHDPVCGLLIGHPRVWSYGTVKGEPVLLRGRQRVPESADRQGVDHQDEGGRMPEENQVGGVFRRIEELPRRIDQLYDPAGPADPQAEHVGPRGRDGGGRDRGPVGQQ